MRDAHGAGEGGAARLGTPRVVPAKVRVPMPVQAPLPRERIEARLAGSFGKRLTLVVAHGIGAGTRVHFGAGVSF